MAIIGFLPSLNSNDSLKEKCTNEHVMILFIDAYYFLLFVLFYLRFIVPISLLYCIPSKRMRFMLS